MSDLLSEIFNEEYLCKVDMKGRLEILYSFREKSIEENNINELLMINGFLEIINGQVEKAESYFNSNLLDSEDAIIKLARGMINITKAEKEDDYQLYYSTVKELEYANFYAGSCSLFIKLLLNHAYYLLGEKQHDRRKEYYVKAYEIVDSVIEEDENLIGRGKEKLVRFYNDKGNILLQLADFDEENQPLIYDTNNKIKIFNEKIHKLDKIKKIKRVDCLNAAKACFHEAIILNNKFAYAYNGLGNFYRENGNWDKALENYDKAIKLDCEFFYPLNYIGDCYRLKGMYKEAEESFNKAIKINDKHAFSLYGLGKVYYELGTRIENGVSYLKKAEKYFVKAKKYDDSFPYAWFDLARTRAKLESVNVPKLDLGYILKDIENITEQELELSKADKEHEKKKWNKSKEELEKKISDYYDGLEKYYNEIREIYMGSRERFIRKYPYEKTKCEHWKNTIKYCIEDLDKKVMHYNKLKDIGIKIVNGEKDVEAFEKILFYTISTGIEEQTISNEKHFVTTFLNNKVPTTNNIKAESKHILHILRRWNSYTPIIADNSKGGGYFIECKGNGIVIDPGHNFIDNFKQAGFKFADISSILISHSHDDHTADLESIINLLYRYNKQLKEHTIPDRIAKEKGVATKTVNDILNDIHSVDHSEYKKLAYNLYLHEKKEIKFYISEGVFIKYSGIFRYDEKCKIDTNSDDIQKEEVKKMIEDINDYKKKYQNKKKVLYYVKVVHSQDQLEIGNGKIQVIKAHHKDLFDNDSSLGFMFEFDKTALIYTGDTGWEEIEGTYREIKDKLKNKKIVLLSHIGGFKTKEIKVLDLIPDKSYYYENHLGRLGLVEINKILKPHICVISEFGEEFKFNRVQIAKIYNKTFEHSEPITRFLPADIGLCIDLDSTLISTIVGIDADCHKIEYNQAKVEDVLVGEYKKGNSLFYFDKINLTENECLQALAQDYESCLQEIVEKKEDRGMKYGK